MSVQTDNLLSLVEPYGLSTEESKIYLHLLRHGFLTALKLSRQLKIGRTKVYRLLDKLKEKQLVEHQVHTRGMKFGATHPKKLEQIVAQQENEVESLKQTLPNLVDQLTSLIYNDVYTQSQSFEITPNILTCLVYRQACRQLGSTNSRKNSKFSPTLFARASTAKTQQVS